MDNLIEVEIENRSYIELLNLNKINHKIINLTTLVNNQTAVKIKIFLNRSGNRTLLKEFYIRKLKPKVSGLPRFELNSSYNGKFLSLDLMVDGKKTDHSEINLRPYLRNKFLPLFIILGIISLLLLLWGGKWILNANLFRSDNHIQANITEPKKLNIPISVRKNDPVKTDQITQKEQSQNTGFTTFFLPNDTSIQKDASQILDKVMVVLQTNPNSIVEISGHCAMTGTEEGRERLSKERAYNVLDYLKKEGWIPNTKPVVKWYGGTKPVTLNQKEIYRNRRVEITIDIP